MIRDQKNKEWAERKAARQKEWDEKEKLRLEELFEEVPSLLVHLSSVFFFFPLKPYLFLLVTYMTNE